MGRERFPEYRAIFSELAEACDRENVELVLIAGDVFDASSFHQTFRLNALL